MLWGLYHGLLLLVTQSAGRVRRCQAARQPRRWLLVPQIAGMFVLTNIGWLLFRETELAAIVRDLTLSPFGVSELDRQTGALSVPAGVPLFGAALGPEPLGRAHRGAAARPPPTPSAPPLPPMPRLVAAGRRLRPGARGDPRPAQPRRRSISSTFSSESVVRRSSALGLAGSVLARRCRTTRSATMSSLVSSLAHRRLRSQVASRRAST